MNSEYIQSMGTTGLFKMTFSGAATSYIADPNNNNLYSSRRVSRDDRGALLRSGTIAVLICNALHRLYILYDKPLYVECVHTFCLAGYWRWSALDSQRRGLFVCPSASPMLTPQKYRVTFPNPTSISFPRSSLERKMGGGLPTVIRTYSIPGNGY